MEWLGQGSLARPRERFNSGYLSALPIVAASFFGFLLSGPRTAAGEIALGAASPESSKIHPSLRGDFAGNDGNGVKAWIYFERSKGTAGAETRAAAISEISAIYPARAKERRRLRRTAPGLFDERDLPVPADYLRSIEAIGARIHVASRWLNAASARVTPEQIERIAALSFVERVEPVRRGKYELPKESSDSMTVRLGSFYGQSAAQLQQIRLTAVHDAGYTGAGVVVGVLDTGFHRTHDAYNEPGHVLSVIAEYDFVNGDGHTGIDPGDHPDQHRHGTWVLGTMAAYKPGSLVGGAFDASYILCKTEDITDEYPAEEDNYVAGLEFIEFHGGDVATASLGYIDWYTQADLDGLTAVTTVAVNVATENGVHCLGAAGNSGHDANPATSRLIAPADAFEMISCGAVDNTGQTANFSSDGPTADGRVKPELLARGVNTRTVSSANNTDYSGLGGTSLSTPLVASAVACLVQAHPDWSVERMRRYLMYSAQDYVLNGSHDPLYVRGYGIVDAAAALAEDCNGNSQDDPTDIATKVSNDCNENLFPDECDIAQGFSMDLDEDGVPDECDCTVRIFGDVAPEGGDGIVEVGDVLCVLAGYGDLSLCPDGDIAPCNGDGIIEVSDVLNVLAAYAGNGPCANSCVTQ